MKNMTEEQFKHAIAQLLTTVKPRTVNGDRAQIAIKDPSFAERFGEFLSEYEVRPKPAPQIIAWLSNLTIPAQPRFVVSEKFTKENKEVKFWDIGFNFRTWFGSMTEGEVGETEVRVGKLKVTADFAAMTPVLGESRLTTASQFYWMLSQQPKGEKPNGKNCLLLTNGYANFFRILDKYRNERVALAGWSDSSGWLVDALGLEYGFVWGGTQVISRK